MAKRKNSTFLKLKRGKIISTNEALPPNTKSPQQKTQQNPSGQPQAKRSTKEMELSVFNCLKFIFVFSIIALIVYLGYYFVSKNTNISESLIYPEQSDIIDNTKEFNDKVSNLIKSIDIKSTIEDKQERNKIDKFLEFINKNNQIIKSSYNSCKTNILAYTNEEYIRRQARINTGNYLEALTTAYEGFKKDKGEYDSNYIILTILDKRYKTAIEYETEMTKSLNKDNATEAFNEVVLTDMELIKQQRQELISFLESYNIDYNENNSTISTN